MPRSPFPALLMMALVAPAPWVQPPGAVVDRLAAAVQAEVVVWRRHLHEHPELPNREVETAKYIATRIRETAERIANAAGATVDVAIERGYPVTSNDPALTARMLPTLQRVASGKVTESELVPAAEDFSYFQREAPGLGAAGQHASAQGLGSENGPYVASVIALMLPIVCWPRPGREVQAIEAATTT